MVGVLLVLSESSCWMTERQGDERHGWSARHGWSDVMLED